MVVPPDGFEALPAEAFNPGDKLVPGFDALTIFQHASDTRHRPVVWLEAVAVADMVLESLPKAGPCPKNPGSS